MADDEETKKELEMYDLSKKIIPYLDKHLVFQMLMFLKELEIYKEEDIAVAELTLAGETRMLDLVKDKYEELGKDLPATFEDDKVQVVQEMQAAGGELFQLLEILENEEHVKRINALKSIKDICDEFTIPEDYIEGLASYAKLQYEAGNYQLCQDLLKNYRYLNEKDEGRLTVSKNISCLWGSIASLILLQQYDAAADAIEQMHNLLEEKKMTKREVLLQRTWLVHWDLFAIFRIDKSSIAPTKALDIILHEKSLSVISLSCPHIFRYVCACLILQKRLKLLLKETVWIIHSECQNYNDPITRFLVSLYIDLDFEQAQRELLQCKNVCKSDFFLASHWTDFEENARLLIFETYCRIHQSINIATIAPQLNMTPEEAELWIVKLIQNAKLDARIDSEKSRVIMSKAPPSVYRQVIEKTKNLSFRSTMLLSNLEKHEATKKGVVA